MSKLCSYNYYVYTYLREDGSPYYIGKGRIKRTLSEETKNKMSGTRGPLKGKRKSSPRGPRGPESNIKAWETRRKNKEPI